MIDFTNTTCLPAYTTREVRNFGLFKKDTLYKYLFSIEDNALLNTGAIKLLPFNMLECKVSHGVILNTKKYEAGEDVDVNDFDEKTFKVLVKTNVIKVDLAKEIKELDDVKIIELAKSYECVGKTFKEVSEILNIPFDTLKDAFDLKQGGNKKKLVKENLIKLQELLEK